MMPLKPGLCKCGHTHLFSDRCGGPIICTHKHDSFPCYLGATKGYPHEHACECITHDPVALIDFYEYLCAKDLAICHHSYAWELAKTKAKVEFPQGWGIMYWMAVRTKYLGLGGQYIDSISAVDKRHYCPHHSGCNGIGRIFG
jgi:hypothetical protein